MAPRSRKKKAAVVTATPRLDTPWPGNEWLRGLVLVAAIILVYIPVWWAGYIWDDELVFATNPCVVGPLGLKEIWTTSAADICPMTLTTFWAEHQLWGLAPMPYHVTNVLMHAAAAIVLWRVLRVLRIPGAWLGAAIWALHPVEVESVAWVSEMKNTQSALFYLLAILFFIRGRSERGYRDYAFTLLFAFLALTSKSSTVVLPVVLILCAWWVEGRWQWKNIIAVTPIFAMSIAVGLVSILTQSLRGSGDPHTALSGAQRLIIGGNAVWFYLGKLAWPHPLIMVYPRWQIDGGVWFEYLPLLAVVVVSAVLAWKFRRPWFFVWAYFLVAVGPVLGLVNFTFSHFSFVADHFQYLAAMGPLALTGAGLALRGQRGKLWLLPGVGLLLLFGFLSWQRTWAYESQEILWTDTLQKNPECLAAYNNLGMVYAKQGRLDDAISEFGKALAIRSDYAEALTNLGLALARKGFPDQAADEYEKAIAADPDFVEAHNNLGNYFSRQNRMEEAIPHYKKAIEVDPYYTEAHNDLGFALLQTGHVDEGMSEIQKALEIHPDSASAHNNLGLALVKKGRMNDAVFQFQEAVRLDPSLATARENLLRGEAALHQ